jgi:hypothetical protein
MTEYTMIYTHISMYIHVFLLGIYIYCITTFFVVVAISLHRTLALARPSRPLNCGTPPSSHRDSRWGIRDGDPGWSELDGNNRRGVAGIPVFCSTFYRFHRVYWVPFIGFIGSFYRFFYEFFGWAVTASVSVSCQCQGSLLQPFIGSTHPVVKLIPRRTAGNQVKS